MRLIAPFIAALALGSADTLRLGLEDGTKVTKSFSSALELELVGLTIEIGDEEFEVPEDERGEVVLTNVEEIVVTDRYESVEDGRPTVIVRTFDTLDDTSRQAVTAPGEDDPDETEDDGESALVDRTVRFEWDGDDEEYDASFDDDGDDDDDLLEGLRADADFLFLLPGGGFGDAVDEGDTWELEPEVFNFISMPSGDVGFVSEGDDELEEEGDPSEQLLDNIDGEFEAQLVSTDGEVAVIALKFEGSTSAESTFDIDGEEVTQEMELVFECEGELEWDLERGVAIALTFGGDVEMTVTVESDGEERYARIQSYEGSLEITAAFE